ncbi:MAG TPA: hypothetical protein VLG28_01085 [Acidimicrobiia bacterium]|jgi:hypothetical protein|nr:hypothetical protein [Acidimicrobiia bacterium]
MMVAKPVRLLVTVLVLLAGKPLPAASAQTPFPDGDPAIRAIVVLDDASGMDPVAFLESLASEEPGASSSVEPVRL